MNTLHIEGLTDLRDVPPPYYLTTLQKIIWAELAAMMKPGWAADIDIPIFHALVRFVERQRKTGLSPREVGLLRRLLREFGMTPSSPLRRQA